MTSWRNCQRGHHHEGWIIIISNSWSMIETSRKCREVTNHVQEWIIILIFLSLHESNQQTNDRVNESWIVGGLMQG